MPVVQPSGGVLTAQTLAELTQLQQFGAGTGQINGCGDLLLQTASAGISPGATNADNVLAVYSIPANSFDVAGRVLYIMAAGTFANNTNSKRVKIIFNPSVAVVGSTVGSGGTTIADTGAWTTTGLTPFILEAQVQKYGVAGSNTQMAIPLGVVLGTTHGGIGSSAFINATTAVENAPILIAVTGNAATTAADILLYLLQIQGVN